MVDAQGKADLSISTDEYIIDTKADFRLCKSPQKEDAGGNLSSLCPQCNSQDVCKDGNRTSIFGDVIQRWLCKKCSLRFSDPKQQALLKSKIKKLKAPKTAGKSIKSERALLFKRQICAKGAKNLEPEQISIQVPERIVKAKGMLVQFEAKTELDGYTEATRRGYIGTLHALIKRGADLEDPESVKKVLAVEEAKPKHWSQNRRRNVINAYTLFLGYQGKSWKKPKCTVDIPKPFIPTEAEIDSLIAGTFPKLSAFLQVLKETAFRSGEAHRLQWTDVDRANLVITLNKPEKHSNARMIKVSAELVDTLYNLQKTSIDIFPTSLKGLKVTFSKARKRLALKLNNPRLLKIHFHTFRHWKATMLYHETKDAIYVRDFLGHKSIKSTEIYINIERAIFQTGPNDKFVIKVSREPEEITRYLSDGFEEATKQGDLIYLRKRK